MYNKVSIKVGNKYFTEQENGIFYQKLIIKVELQQISKSLQINLVK